MSRDLLVKLRAARIKLHAGHLFFLVLEVVDRGQSSRCTDLRQVVFSPKKSGFFVPFGRLNPQVLHKHEWKIPGAHIASQTNSILDSAPPRPLLSPAF